MPNFVCSRFQTVRNTLVSLSSSLNVDTLADRVYTWVHLGTPGYTWVHLGTPGGVSGAAQVNITPMSQMGTEKFARQMTGGDNLTPEQKLQIAEQQQVGGLTRRGQRS